MASAYIFGIATAVPSPSLTQQQYTQFLSQLLELTPTQRAVITRFGQGTEIQKRYTVIEDFFKDREDWSFFDRAQPAQFPSTYQRNELYKVHAPRLSFESATKVIKAWGQPPASITHLIYVSCTGLMAPGVEFLLTTQLGLPSHTQRLAINFMGCFGAFRSLAMAKALALQNPRHRILIVCTELCTLHIQPDQKLDTIIGNALFADGSAAMVVGSEPTRSELPWWEIEHCDAAIVDNSPTAMTWDISNQGFVMRLSADIPTYLSRGIRNFADRVLQGHDSASVDWPVHPGGKGILNAIAQSCSISEPQLKSSWHIMRNYGNMSSPTFPFVLEHLYHNGTRPWAIGLGFGPGLSMEGVLLRRQSEIP